MGNNFGMSCPINVLTETATLCAPSFVIAVKFEIVSWFHQTVGAKLRFSGVSLLAWAR